MELEKIADFGFGKRDFRKVPSTHTPVEFSSIVSVNLLDDHVMMKTSWMHNLKVKDS